MRRAWQLWRLETGQLDRTCRRTGGGVMERELLFRVIGKNGHEYKIFTNGEIEGFPPDATGIANYYPRLMAEAMARNCSEPAVA